MNIVQLVQITFDQLVTLGNTHNKLSTITDLEYGVRKLVVLGHYCFIMYGDTPQVAECVCNS